MEEREFYNESEVSRPATLNCPRCRTQDTYELRWIQRKKKPSLPPRANDDDRRRFAKLRDYSVRRDDMAKCKKCGKSFEVSGVQSVAFDQ